MASVRKNPSYYKDIDLNFSKNFLTDDFNTVTGINSISQSIKNIILTNKGERPFSNVGSNVMNIINEPDSLETIYQFKDTISSMLNLYEPRINVSYDDVSKQILPDGSIRININYRIINDFSEGIPRSTSFTVSPRT